MTEWSQGFTQEKIDAVKKGNTLQQISEIDDVARTYGEYIRPRGLSFCSWNETDEQSLSVRTVRSPARLSRSTRACNLSVTRSVYVFGLIAGNSEGLRGREGE